MAEIQYDEYPQVAIYSDKCAMQVKAQVTKGGFHTVALEFATLIPGSQQGKKAFDWKNSTSLQLTDQELPIVACLALGHVQFCNWKNRGMSRDKNLRIQHQQSNLYIQCSQAGQEYALPVSAPDTFHFSAFLVQQLQKNHPMLSVADTLALLASTTGPMAHARLEAYRAKQNK